MSPPAAATYGAQARSRTCVWNVPTAAPLSPRMVGIQWLSHHEIAFASGMSASGHPDHRKMASHALSVSRGCW